MSAREKAISYLARFARTEFQLRRYLQRKGFVSEEITDTIQFLREHNFLNDTSYAQAYIVSRISRFDGPLKIKQLLIQKGISGTEAQRLLQSQYPVELQIENAKKLLTKRARTRIQQQRWIASRGYPRYVMMQALRETTDKHR
jgi:regulatory protein